MTILGRENFDYVTMDNYSADLADLSAQAAVAIQSKQSEVKTLQRMIWLLVQASGGTIEIPRDVTVDYSPETALLTVEYLAHNMSTLVTAR